MQKTLAEIATIVNGEVVGDKDLVITGLNGIDEAKDGDLTFLANLKYESLAKKTKASAILVSRDTHIPEKSLIRTDNPSLAFTELMSKMCDAFEHPFTGVHATAVIGENCSMGQNVSIGPNAIVEANAVIGDNTVIYGGSYIGESVIVGQNCLIYANVAIRERCVIGHNVIVHCGAVIGSDGFGYVQVKGEHKKIPQIGTVTIEDDVEIGANVTIDRARFDTTIIGQGTKIDNLVHVAHNVITGKNCIFIAQAGISGSTRIGNNVYLLGQAGTAGHISIGDNSIIFSQSSVIKSVPDGTHISGSPGRPHMQNKRAMAASLKLPKYIKAIRDLEQRVKDLESKND